jgi:hypothetical protein
MKVITIILSLLSLSTHAQDLTPEKLELFFKDGITFKEKNDFMMRMRLRMQNRFTLETEEADETTFKNSEFTVRRVRLRFDGFALDPRLLYRLQFSFTRADQDWDNSQVPNILRDAVVGWRWDPQHTLWFGLAKLPGNRQRVISSSAQQFVDRSIVNATFNIDRDVGLQHYSQFGGQKPIWLKLALSNGEGRNQPNRNASLATTTRLEWYPLGAFHDDGDNFEADLYREPKPRLGLGISQSTNHQTSRTGGQIGRDLGEGIFRTLDTRFVDLVFKYRGLSLSSEWAKRTAPSPIISNKLFVTTGEGVNIQSGYIFESNWEPSVRWSTIRPAAEIQTVAQEQRQYVFGLSKYIKNHVVKVQGDLTYQELVSTSYLDYKSHWILRLQIEVGI